MGKPRLIYQVAVGNCPDFYETCISSVRAYSVEVGATHLVQREAILKIRPVASKRSRAAVERLGYLPIYEKENALKYLGQYDQVLILDADVYIRPGAANIFEAADTPFAGVVERSMPLTPAYRDKVRKHSEGQFGTLKDVNWKWDHRGAHYFNMGVMLLEKSLLPYLDGDTPERFIRRPEFERFVNGEGHWKWSTDQTMLNWFLKQQSIPTTDLDWTFNGMYGANPRALEADFIHFFLSAKLPRKGAEIPEIIAGL